MNMKRRAFIGTLSAAGLGQALAQTTQSPVTSSPNHLLRTPLTIMAPRADGFEAVWAVSRLSLGRIEWESDDGTTGSAGADTFGFVPQGEDILRVRVAGLSPGKNYRVRSVTRAADNDETQVSAWKTFRTLDPTAHRTHFTMWNDTHIHNDTIRALHQVTPAADFLLWNGDTCNDWTRDELLVPTLLHPGECDITERAPLFITWGNHDVRGAHAFKTPRLIATPTGRPFYAFRSGPVAVICLHTGEDKPDSHPSFRGRVAFDTLRAEQAQWLRETIQRPELRDAPYRVVFCHIPLRWRDEQPPNYDKGGFDHFSARSRAAWHETLVKWRAQIILSGHTHRDAWLPPTSEFPYGQLIGGGPQKERATWTEGVADTEQLRIKVINLEGKVLRDVTFKPLA
ncbi:MAG TPA: metallophosphoesterase family protein [Verrucomicrobiota bacterium]|nr:metallophosphoesterase family protein [Verrucomicrobiota bacterium]HNT13713.1 metallophosphoesterase family protein [Verrucomicrobiota bacterium]